MRFSELDGKKIGIWGLGRETRSFAAHVRTQLPGAAIEVVVRENAKDDASDLIAGGARVVDAAEAVTALSACDFVVRSPGVSIYRPELKALAEAGIGVATATGLWLAERRGRRVIGVTGTKGKSTTATLIAHLATAAGHDVHLAGNIGRPALDLLSAPSSAWAIIELSSYQVADLTCGSELAVITNIYEDHADWHGSATRYRRDKLRLLSLPGVRTCILPRELAAECGSADVRHFDVTGSWHVSGDGVRHPDGTQIPSHLFPLRGRHNAVNLCAALAALDAAELKRPPLPSALADVHPLPHRLQTVHEANGIEWVDDSISTTPESAIAALKAFADRPVVLISGGQDRGQDYTALGHLAAQRDAAVIGLPTTGTRFVAAAVGAGVSEGRALQVADMAEAVKAAQAFAISGAVVLLSPAAPSFNLYRDFEERGDHFAALASAR
ncbi:MAG TPA: UDP-N-acetylmuramoyl-L-alanine--D-glutamate ligase [Solirubrobacterales bacterium]|nr:UDP-N-acetylmuramoyl-L-alanine--D-glutamate ligase [Solirubrobacterales bacterium]